MPTLDEIIHLSRMESAVNLMQAEIKALRERIILRAKEENAAKARTKKPSLPKKKSPCPQN